MKAMVLAAGLGTRLKPITDSRPKALVEIDGRSLLQIALMRLRQYGIFDVIVNVHHFADMIVDYLRANDNFGMRIAISREDVLLDTGGGLKKAGWFFLENSSDEPFVLHNVDVISTVDLPQMVQFHLKKRALATLAVKSRETSRPLVFDSELQLCGRGRSGDPTKVSLAFSGIHVISPRLIPMLHEKGPFSIITSYVELAGRGERILAFRADEYYWRDLGKPVDLRQAAEDIKAGLAQLHGR
jgi:NDP-sugar pyrophosphorylase family protein